MHLDHAKGDGHLKRTASRGPMFVAIAAAIVGILAILIVDHGPWSAPQAQTAEVASYQTTEQATRAAGASVTPTAPQSQLEPAAPGPKLAAPASPAAR